jgi:thiol-disulfide isomerase/thioredoxin
VTLSPLDGGPDRKLGELLGSKPVVLNFYASWCGPCITEMPAFEQVHQEVGDKVTIIGIAYQDRDEDALATVERTGVTYPTFGDSGQDAVTYFGGISMPTSVFIDAAGNVVDVRSRALDADALRSALDDRFGIAA